MLSLAGPTYLAGPMTGRAQLNYPAFNAVAAWARALGRAVVSPAEFGIPPGTPWEDCMRVAVRALTHCGEVLLLPGWLDSRGAQREAEIAQGVLGIPVSELTLDEICRSAIARGGSVDDGLVIQTVLSLLHAEVSAGNDVEVEQHFVSPDQELDVVWGCDPYGVDYLVCQGSCRPEPWQLAELVSDLVRDPNSRIVNAMAEHCGPDSVSS